METWNWNDSFVVKDAMSIMRKITHNEPFVSSYQTDLFRDLVNVMFDCPEKPELIQPKVFEPKRIYDNVCLTSGGADSTIIWYWANKPRGLYIDIGQSYAKKELAALKSLEIPHHYVDLRGTHLADNCWKHVIPGRNFIFLSIAAEMLKNHGNIWFAVVDGEGFDSEKGDKSSKFINLFQEWYLASTGRYVYVQDATMHTKAGWLDWFSKKHDLDIIRYKTVTCFSAYKGSLQHADYQCGSCQACLRKYLSFMSIGMDIAKDFVAHPMFGAQEYVIKYKKVLNESLEKQHFDHYSRKRCEEDLAAIAKAEELMLAGQTE